MWRDSAIIRSHAVVVDLLAAPSAPESDPEPTAKETATRWLDGNLEDYELSDSEGEQSQDNSCQPPLSLTSWAWPRTSRVPPKAFDCTLVSSFGLDASGVRLAVHAYGVALRDLSGELLRIIPIEHITHWGSSGGVFTLHISTNLEHFEKISMRLEALAELSNALQLSSSAQVERVKREAMNAPRRSDSGLALRVLAVSPDRPSGSLVQRERSYSGAGDKQALSMPSSSSRALRCSFSRMRRRGRVDSNEKRLSNCGLPKPRPPPEDVHQWTLF
uniref:Uncharacterized protein n=1 Tax=Haptolina brevifila TaxID=156173 RepID=A0A7S2E2F5_9EUKA|mmetsp:Transcript_47299/g.94303  ORF Transcript_47299/g.94303 Transcript_47299/m.94303 type:complete len:274 (+) Transcript_47299:161-982(+)